MNGANPPEHPDDDLLADLAADVLPTHQARAVEAHVMSCSHCTSVLTDAEQVRNLLLTDDPGPMPPDVLARLDQVLQIEVAARDGMADYPPSAAPTPAPGQLLPDQPAGRTTPVRVISPWEDTTTIEAFEVARKRQTAARKQDSDAGSATASAQTSAGIGSPRSRGPRLTRPSRGPSRSRRDMREEVRDVKAGRRGTVLAAATGVVVLLGLGGYVVVALLGNRGAGQATSAASSVEAAPKVLSGGEAGGPPVLTSGTNYTRTSLAQQATVLVSRVNQVPTRQQRTAAALAPGGAGAGAGSTSGAVPGPFGASAADAGNDALRNPATLNGCLAALEAGGRRPVAIDLARFDGRDAAIIVLNGTNGGYEVWAVERGCRPGADGTITYLDLTP